MSSHYLVILMSFIFPFRCSTALERPAKHGVWQQAAGFNALSYQQNENGVTVNSLRSWKGQDAMHPRHPLTNVHGMLSIIGWGTILPLGVIVARFFKKFPLKCDEWYNLHIVCQILGYIVGGIGWGIGISLGSSSSEHHHTSTAHRILGIIIFAFATVQMVDLCLQPKRVCKCWEMYHGFLGYALIGMIVANIFIGIAQADPHPALWKWAYVTILALLAFLALSLQIWTCLILRRMPTSI